MSDFLKIIDAKLDGNSWEDICVKCYQYRYANEHYTPVPAVSGGDAGIEGYTKTGIVHQCYCPERQFSDNELYDAQRDKLSADIKKLLENGARLKELGVPQIHEWHFNIPEYKDAKILKHAVTKQNEVLDKIKSDPAKYAYIAEDFQIIVKTANSFPTEINRIIRESAEYNINLAFKHNPSTNWEFCDSQKSANIRRKIKAVMHIADDSNPRVANVVGLYIDYYIRGLENMNRLRTSFPEIHAELFSLEQSYKGEVSIKTTMHTNQAANQELFNQILLEFEEKLQKDFGDAFNQASITEIKQDMVAGWLADCSMEFWSDN